MTLEERVERDVRELAQAIVTLEVVFSAFVALVFRRMPREKDRFSAALRNHSNRALFERDGLDPVLLDRIVDYIRSVTDR